MKFIYIIPFLFLSFIASRSFSQASAQIGGQVWTTKNLDVDKFRNGDPIMQVRTFAELKKAGEDKKPAWCYLDFDPVNGIKYGRLYNWYAVTDPRGLAPSGWHIPSTIEWYELFEFLGGEDRAGTKLKLGNGWRDYFEGDYDDRLKQRSKGTNETGFSAIPSNVMWYVKSAEANSAAYYWSSTERDDEWSFATYISYLGPNAKREVALKGWCLSVRMVKN